MCGILGYTGNHPHFSKENFSVALDELQHRGPDDSGLHFAELNASFELAFGQRRLAILDLSPLGHQPMFSPKTGNPIVFNGEIFNFQAVREELKKVGYVFHSNCDTEVILAAYDEWGTDCVQHFNGMFAFCIHDLEKEILFLARDRMGIKPLYYYFHQGQFAFSSELIALLKIGISEKKLNPENLAEFFAFGYFPRESTPLDFHHKLLPGHTIELCLKKKTLTIKPFWDASSFLHKDSSKGLDPTSKLETLLEDAVKRRMISDVPLGAFLSGGIDSSLIVALMQKNHTEKVKTFSIGFTVPEWDEAPHAKKVADYLGTEHHEFYVSPKGLEEILPKVLEYYDEPYADTSSIPTSILSQMTREHVTVALSGDGGDELHFGYSRYWKAEKYIQFQKFPLFLRNSILWLQSKKNNQSLERLNFFMNAPSLSDYYIRNIAFIEKLFPSSVFEKGHYKSLADQLQSQMGTSDWKKLIPAIDTLAYLPDDLLVKTDRASMAFALEVRVPFMDHHFVEFSLGLPTSVKSRGNESKTLLRNILAKHVPRPLWERPKQGFGIPVEQWLRNDLKDWVLDELTGHLDWLGGILPQEVVEKIIERFFRGEANLERIIWSFLSLKSWMKRAQMS